ncbi:MAG: NAD(+)/NADH kinase [Eubacteriaceae bacterium]|jgi:NAD+ kinase
MKKELGTGFREIGLYANTDKPESIALAVECAKELQKMGIKTPFLSRQADEYFVQGSELLPKDEFFSRPDCIIVLGGDGTLLSVARLASSTGMPLFGINTGKLGFLTEGEGREFKKLLDELVSGETWVDPRMMLECTAELYDGRVENFTALNDVVVKNGCMRMMEFNVCADGQKLALFRADGLIVSTPTGSTAYSLAAGGPIIHPRADVLTVTPIAPQHLHDRPFVLPGDTVLTMSFQKKEHSIIVSMDGQREIYVNGQDEIIIRRSDRTANLIRLKNSNVYERIRKKLFYEE